MASISWTEGEGSGASTVTLESPRPAPGNRFFDTVSDYDPVGDAEVTLTGETHTFLFREDYLLSLTIKHLRPAQYANMLACKRHLMNGGEVTITTDDASATTYSNVRLAPGTKPEIKMNDDNRNLRDFSCVLVKSSALTVNYDV